MTSSKKNSEPPVKKSGSEGSKKQNSLKNKSKTKGNSGKTAGSTAKTGNNVSSKTLKRATAPKRQKKSTKVNSRRITNRKNETSVSQELKKGFTAVFLLVCVVGISAMGADLYFNGLLSGTNREKHSDYVENISGTDQNRETNTGENAKINTPHLKAQKKKSRNIADQPENLSEDGTVTMSQEKKIDSRDNKSSSSAKSLAQPDSTNMSEEKNKISPLFEIFDDEPVQKDSLSLPSKDQMSEGPRVAIIIDDIGFDMKMADKLAAIDTNITFAILPAAPFALKAAHKLHTKGMELMLHLPMQPVEYPEVNPGPGAILTSMSPDEVVDTLRKNLDALPYITGVNNHMGSAITALSPQVHQIFTVLKQRKLFFIDSLTSSESLCSQAAHLFQIPFGHRDVFLDNIQTKQYIINQIRKLVTTAKKNGFAIGIGHPYPATYIALRDEISNLKKHVKIVPASQVVGLLE
ncbi:conserved exported hypothetical protein [Desulfamplus magnetovallimortis]|uniref:Divergent polysaccharide deacetylase family protein n=1 Tax=Desulfamplus magnetovallimortis TaxID=1246637 RepID=A0A1W1HIQ6_9BACT|nr:divergent polysaccharide deacetylase family protein [Desulfamplus magnetovallimortis]SLM32326.1 conserved exported hypothetical protein [Desulfamplus magnetovallimortis]